MSEIEKNLEILKQAINYNEDGSVRQGNWMLGTDGIESVKVAIQVLEKQIPKKCFDEIDFGRTCCICRVPHKEGLYCSACGQRLEW